MQFSENNPPRTPYEEALMKIQELEYKIERMCGEIHYLQQVINEVRDNYR